ncbi:MAG: hypothetical protein U9P00_05010 [Pseudomonadota bacterium]|nr:hypothetical protein [Pseudomonadota bacterium]
MAQDKGFFDKLGEILNAPLPGTQAPASQTEASAGDDDDSILERIKDILNAPLPGTPQVETGNEASGTPVGQPGQADTAATQAHEKTPEFDEDELDEAWWKQDWAAFRAHQAQERNGLDLKQRRDQEKFVAYQQQEKQRFDGHQQQEFAAYTHQQQWRLTAWKQAVASSPPGQKPPPPPWEFPPGQQSMPPGGPMGGPRGGPPPWMRPPGPGRRRS